MRQLFLAKMNQHGIDGVGQVFTGVNEGSVEVKNKQFGGMPGDGPIFANHPFSVYPGEHLRI
jgi:hypothetical protein